MDGEDEGLERTADPWRKLLVNSLDEVVGEERRRSVVDPDGLEGVHTCAENVEWTADTMDRLERHLDEDERIEVLNRCAHVMPEPRLAVRRELFQRTRDLGELHAFCQRDFLEHLERWYGPLPTEWLDHIVRNGWGEAGILQGGRVIVTKLPADLSAYFAAQDDQARRRAYCHCHRIEGAFEPEAPAIAPIYCHCGAGFYRYNWEKMIGRPVRVKVLRSLLAGDEVCQFEVVLPDDL